MVHPYGTINAHPYSDGTTHGHLKNTLSVKRLFQSQIRSIPQSSPVRSLETVR
jgi:hypothetical protein